MPRRASSFTRAEVARAVRGAIEGGMTVSGVEIDQRGRIVVLSASQSQPFVENPEGFERRLREGTGWER
jgi:hypothetical protein